MAIVTQNWTRKIFKDENVIKKIQRRVFLHPFLGNSREKIAYRSLEAKL
mgnify:CR=1 FL=1